MLVKLVGRHQVQMLGFELQVHAIGIVESAVIAGEQQVAAAGHVAASAIGGSARNIQIGIGGTVLPRREKQVKSDPAEFRRFVPDRVIHRCIELDAVVASGIAHDGRHIADHAGEGIQSPA
jgi:hypothetical protein